jgi:hypothetical protein
MPRHVKPRLSRRRLLGQRILDFVATYHINGVGIESVTTARKFVRENGIRFPAVIKVQRNPHTVDSFFLAEKGMFGLAYAEFSWLSFPCLQKIYRDLDEKEFLTEQDKLDMSLNEESYRPEYAFI